MPNLCEIDLIFTPRYFTIELTTRQRYLIRVKDIEKKETKNSYLINQNLIPFGMTNCEFITEF